MLLCLLTCFISFFSQKRLFACNIIMIIIYCILSSLSNFQAPQRSQRDESYYNTERPTRIEKCVCFQPPPPALPLPPKNKNDNTMDDGWLVVSAFFTSTRRRHNHMFEFDSCCVVFGSCVVREQQLCNRTCVIEVRFFACLKADCNAAKRRTNILKLRES